MDLKCWVWLIITESVCVVVWEDFKTKRNGTDDVFSFFNPKFYLQGRESSSILINPWERSVCANTEFIGSTFPLLNLCPVVRVAPNVICFRTHQVLPRILLNYALNYEAWQTCCKFCLCHTYEDWCSVIFFVCLFYNTICCISCL